MDSEDLAALRAEYRRGGLPVEDLDPDPLQLFRRWFAEAREVVEPNAMVLATVSSDGQPSARTVLLKGLDDRGFRFFTNTASHKGSDLAVNPRCALLFGWYPLERQVRVEGTAVPLSRAEVAAYFSSRPPGARLGAFASPQSQVVEPGEVARRFAEAQEQYGDDAPLPDTWGGYVVAPERIEFWQGRENRLHDRWRYRRDRNAEGRWVVENLAP